MSKLPWRARLATTIGGAAGRASRLAGRGDGSVIGGVIALRIEPRLLAMLATGRQIVLVTGTNGKTTTTEWIGHIHREAGLEVAVAGNVGTAVSSLVGAIEPSATVVCECSSIRIRSGAIPNEIKYCLAIPASLGPGVEGSVPPEKMIRASG